MHNENPLSELAFIEASHFADVHLIIHSFPLESVSVYERFLKLNKVNPLKISAIPMTEVLLEMIGANLGVMCVPKWALKSFIIPEELVYKRLGKNGLKREHFLVIRKNDKSKKYVNDFIDSYAEEFED